MKTFAIQVVLLTLLIVLAEGRRSPYPCGHRPRPSNGEKFKEFINTNNPPPPCNPAVPYQTPDGSCNNVNHPLWGAAGTRFPRLLTPVYGDGVGTPRFRATSGSDLPNPRAISNHVHFELNIFSGQNSIMLMQWGQFIDHDITLTPVMTDGGSDIDCCTRSDSVQNDKNSPCDPVDIPNGDAYFPNGTCMNFVRSQPFIGTGTNPSNPRQQLNELSAYIDASHIYGISAAEIDDLRDKTLGAGQMEVSSGDLLPKGDDDNCFLNTSDPTNFCFKAGDSRVNRIPGLSLLHTLFLREHNRVARILWSMHPFMDDETIFQEARRIVIAELQVITYNEWLPEILGEDAIANYSLGFGSYNYDANLDPSLTNVFSTASFRFGHSMVPGNFTIGSEVVETGAIFERTKFLINNLDGVVGSLLDAPGEHADAWYVDGIRNRMFETDPAAKDGFDIVALNIQRGRDHGLPPYNEWREYCGLTKITSFTNGSDFGRLEAQDLEDIYESVDDIDLYSGGISETPNSPAAVGKTYTCLLGEQFKKLRDGNRFWFESTDPFTGFRDTQIDELKKASLSRIICDNADNIGLISPRAFRLIDTSGNELQPCDTLERIRIRMFW